MKRRPIILGCVITVLFGVLWAATMLIVYTDRGFVCENTGSRMGHREWLFGVETNVWYQESKLEEFVKADHPDELQHRWTSYRGTGRGVIMTSRVHGTPGPILDLSPEMLDSYVQSLSGDDRYELYQTFQASDSDQVRERVDAILETQR